MLNLFELLKYLISKKELRLDEIMEVLYQRNEDHYKLSESEKK